MHRRIRWLLVLALIGGCATVRSTGVRNTRQSRYLGLILNARDLGAEELDYVQRTDPAIAAYVARNGAPDFIVMPTLNDVELIYYIRSVLAQFHSPSPDSPSIMGELTPLPGPVLDKLPQDIRAGTPARDPKLARQTGCWTVPIDDLVCRTCCSGVPSNCVSSCQPVKRS